METEFYVLKDGDEYFPQAFITKVGESGEIRKSAYEKKELQADEKIVKVIFTEV